MVVDSKTFLHCVGIGVVYAHRMRSTQRAAPRLVLVERSLPVSGCAASVRSQLEFGFSHAGTASILPVTPHALGSYTFERDEL
jgi:hypothetical protein